MSIYDWLTVAAVVVCLLISAFYSGSETALTASSRAAMMRLEKHGNADATIVTRLLAQRERFLGAVLLANNGTNIAASTLATGLLRHGHVLVRRLVPPERVARLRDAVDRTFEAHRIVARAGPTDETRPWCEPLAGVADLDAHRFMARAACALLLSQGE